MPFQGREIGGAHQKCDAVSPPSDLLEVVYIFDGCSRFHQNGFRIASFFNSMLPFFDFGLVSSYDVLVI